MEQADGVRTTADARVEMRGKTPLGGENLLAGFPADDRLKIADHRRIGVRAEDGAEKIVRGANVGNPIAHGFVDGVLKRAAAGIDADNLRAQQAHPRNVERLPRHVFGTHVHDAFQTEMRGDGGGRNAVLARAGFGDDARLAHFHREQTLTDRVVDFVRAGVQQVFALEIDARTAELLGEARSELQRRRSSREILEQIVKFGLKDGVGLREFVGAFEFEERHHERFGHVAAAVGTEAPGNRGGIDDL